MAEDFMDDDEFSNDITSDRAGAISMLALFEGWFNDEIRKCFVPLSKTQDDSIFGDRGPLGTLSAKIDIGFALGMYGPETKAILHNIRRIRNCFAHDHDAKSFAHPRVAEICRSLPGIPDRDGSVNTDPRAKYNKALMATMFRLHKAMTDRGEARPAPISLLP